MTPLFTAIGEILVDFTPIVRGGVTVGFHMHAGGSPYNVAVGLARLGSRVEFAGKVSTDVFGRFLARTLEQEHVGMRFLVGSPAPTTLAFVTLEGREPSYAFYGTGAADTLLQREDLSPEIVQTDFLHFGSISLLHEPTATTILEVVERVHGSGVISFDPNIRPSLIDDAPAYRRLLDRSLGSADIVKLSGGDARWLLPDRREEEVAEALLERGAALAVVTRGANGCLAATRSLHRRMSAPMVSVVDSIGAGDAFTAGLLFRLAEYGISSRGDVADLTAATLDELLRFASAAAAFACTRAGSDPPRLEEIQTLLGT